MFQNIVDLVYGMKHFKYYLCSIEISLGQNLKTVVEKLLPEFFIYSLCYIELVIFVIRCSLTYMKYTHHENLKMSPNS